MKKRKKRSRTIGGKHHGKTNAKLKRKAQALVKSIRKNVRELGVLSHMFD